MQERQVKPEFWTDDLIATMPDDVRLSYVWMWCVADYEGRIANLTGATLRNGVYRYRDKTILECEAIIDALTDTGRLKFATVNGQHVCTVVNLKKHQKPASVSLVQEPPTIPERDPLDVPPERQPVTKAATKPRAYAIKLNRETWQFDGITDAHMERWRKAYPLLDLDAQLVRAAEWCRLNEHRAPRKAVERFLALTWFSRAQRDAETGTRSNNYGRKPTPSERMAARLATIQTVTTPTNEGELL